MTAPNRSRWFRFSLRWLLFWHLPLTVALALIVTWPDDPAPLPDLPGINVAFHRIGSEILLNMKICAVIVLSLVWFAVPSIAGVVRNRSRLGDSPATHI